MAPATDDERTSFERQAADLLLGRRIERVEYWHLVDGTGEPVLWDHGTWHDAEMGVDLVTDAGRASVDWTSRFYCYGVEALPTERAESLREGLSGWDASGHAVWRERVGQPVERITVLWDRWTVGPARLPSGEIVDPEEEYDVPLALRLDFRVGPVWMVAASPPHAAGDPPFVGGDGIIVVLDPGELVTLGITR